MQSCNHQNSIRQAAKGASGERMGCPLWKRKVEEMYSMTPETNGGKYVLLTSIF